MGLKGQQHDQRKRVYHPKGIAPTVETPTGGGHMPLIVSGPTTTTNMPVKSTENTGMTEHSTKETSEQLTLLPYQTTTSSARDFLARVSQLLASGEVSKILEELCSLRYAELRKQSELRFCCLRMSKDYLITKGGKLSGKSSRHWMNWGMTVNGKCLTARTSESRKTGSECSLSDILEESPDQKYFLSEKQMAWLERESQIDPMFRINLVPQYIPDTMRGGAPMPKNNT